MNFLLGLLPDHGANLGQASRPISFSAIADDNTGAMHRSARMHENTEENGFEIPTSQVVVVSTVAAE